MEIIPYLIDVLLFCFALYWSAANAAVKPGGRTFGLFRYREHMNDKGEPEDKRPAGLRQVTRR